MDLVAITDHDVIEGALTIADRPDVIVGCEVTAIFPNERDRNAHPILPNDFTLAALGSGERSGGTCLQHRRFVQRFDIRGANGAQRNCADELVDARQDALLWLSRTRQRDADRAHAQTESNASHGGDCSSLA